ncbi:hypothetical protein SCRM01_297 [Synechococcus phage S-CRM01]|uniref:hypothetical protein n=1 Tax=Synechococcus phage S-CRM01 TaxID=1026955 RepID=UPI000209E325|nr:hypothetical protein SCRM01_297 [Synechococcus phage S-CRM01]AEC53243.1 hypothetical protein SCRM01_297 [Synechococcus phage S-CRM01]
MAFTLTEEQKEEILEGLKKNPGYEQREERGNPYDSMKGIEYQLEVANSSIEEGKATTNIFYMTLNLECTPDTPGYTMHKVVVDNR